VFPSVRFEVVLARDVQYTGAMKTSLALVLLGLFGLAGCSDKSSGGGGAAPAGGGAAPAAGGSAPSAEDAKAATELFANRCTPCHGAGGAGDGAASAGLTPKPANFTLADWQGKVTDEHIEKIIVFGGQAVGKAAAMPPNPDLDSKPGVVKALRAHIRSLKK